MVCLLEKVKNDEVKENFNEISSFLLYQEDKTCVRKTIRKF